MNRAGIKYGGRIDFWCTYHVCTYHGEKWGKQRRIAGGNADYGMLTEKGLDVSLSGSSSLLAALHGLRLFDGVVLAGCPLEGRAYQQYQVGWKAKADILAGRVESMSGWTKTFLEGLK